MRANLSIISGDQEPFWTTRCITSKVSHLFMMESQRQSLAVSTIHFQSMVSIFRKSQRTVLWPLILPNHRSYLTGTWQILLMLRRQPSERNHYWIQTTSSSSFSATLMTEKNKSWRDSIWVQRNKSMLFTITYTIKWKTSSRWAILNYLTIQQWLSVPWCRSLWTKHTCNWTTLCR